MTTPSIRSLLAVTLIVLGSATLSLSTRPLLAQDFAAPPEFDAVVVTAPVAAHDESPEDPAAVETAEPTLPALVETPPTLQPVPSAATKPAARPMLPVPTSKTVADSVVRPAITRPADPLDTLVDEAIETTGRRMLVVIDKPGFQAEENTPWQIAHGILALRHDYYIRVDGKRTNAIAWVATGPTHNNEPWFVKTRWGGKGHPYTDKWQFEGHPNQFLAFFATAGLPRDFEIQTGDGQSFTIDGWIRNAQMEINDKEEITWTLWAFSTYLAPDARWVDQHNNGWSIEKLVRMQIAVHPTKSACGGMHGLFAVANALNAYDKTGEPRRGVWLEADHYLKTHIAGIKSLQHPDGSFSSNYLKGKEWSEDVDKRVSTSGHTLEFLMNALSDSQLKEAWVRRGIQKVADDLVRYKTQPMEPGGMYHACDALVIYRQRTRPEFAAPRAVPQLVEEPEGNRTSAREPAESSESEFEVRNTSGERPAKRDSRTIDPHDPAFVLPIPVRSSEDEAGPIQRTSAVAPARPSGDGKPRQPAPDERTVPLPGPIISPRPLK